MRGRRRSDVIAAGRRKVGSTWDSGPVSCVSHYRLTLLDVLAQVERQLAQGDALVTRPDPGGGKLLQDFELDQAFRQVVCFVNGDAHGNDLSVVVLDAMVCDGAFAGAATVLAMDRVW